MIIYLIRHSQSIDDIENCYGGIADFELTEAGKNKVREREKQIRNYGIEKIYTSPYKRAYQTAQLLNKNINVEMKIIDDIRELNSHGIRSGVNKELAEEIFSYVYKKQEYKNIGYYLGKTFLGGEDIKEFDKRVKEAINFIIKDSKDLDKIAIVTHSGVHRSIFKNILNIKKKIEKIDDVATTILEYNNNKFELIEAKEILFGENIQ